MIKLGMPREKPPNPPLIASYWMRMLICGFQLKLSALEEAMRSDTAQKSVVYINPEHVAVVEALHKVEKSKIVVTLGNKKLRAS